MAEAPYYPPPYAGLKRLGKALLGVIAFVVLSWGAWFGYALRVYDASTAELRRRGEPVLPEDMDVGLPVVAAGDNAALHYEYAIAKLSWPADVEAWDANRDSSVAWEQSDWDMAAKAGESNPVAMQEARAAVGCNGVRWTMWPSEEIRKSTRGVYAFPFGRYRRLGSTLALSATAATHNGDFQTAQEDAIALQHLGDAIGERPSIIGALVSSAMEAIPPAIVMKMLPTLRIGDGPRNASRTQIKRVIEELLAQDDLPRQYAQALRGERVLVEYRMREFDAYRWRRLLPAWNLDIVRARAGSQAIVAATALANYPAARLVYPTLPDYMSATEEIARFPSAASFLNIRWLLLVDRTIVDRRMAATALAMRLWSLDHPGEKFVSLNQLVPAYLKAVPVDVFDPFGSPIRYVSSDVARLYSVGEDGVDDGAPITERMRKHSWDRWNGNDYPFFLEPMPALPDPAAGVGPVPGGAAPGRR